MSRFLRQPAIRMFAREHYESDLIEQGSGEYAPTFIITKLGAKVNRMMVAGLLERMERRDNDNGANYRGAIRDPTGLHMFNVGSFQQEMHGQMEELLSVFEQSSEPTLVLAIGKASPYTTDDGGVFTGMRMEEFTLINGEGYANWLVETADATLRRIDFFKRSRDLEPQRDIFSQVGIPNDLIPGLISSRGHYTSVDSESYMLGIYQALDSAEGNLPSLSSTPDDTASEDSNDAGNSTENVKEAIIQFLSTNNSPDGVAHDNVMQHLGGIGIDRATGESAVDMLMEEGLLTEATFGYLLYIG